MNALSDPATHAALWKRARSMRVRAVAAIGEPADIAARRALAPETRRDIAGWLARLESIVRKLLLALAAQLLQEEQSARRKAPRIEQIRLARFAARPAPPMARTASGAIPANASAKNARRVDLMRPETWPVRFAFAPPRDPHLVPESRAPRIRALWGPPPPPPPQPPPRVRRAAEPALRFAFRLEALRRVLDDPISYAQRLARIFPRLIRRYPEAAHRYAIAPARPHADDDGDPRLIIDVMGLAMVAAHLFPNTS
ncbi:MAG: hypothetical protein AB7H66_01775 [Hyphomonadaceae bacterium]